MKIEAIKRLEKDLRIKIEGEGHTFCSALQEALLEDERVEFAGYRMPHPLIGYSTFYIRVKGKDVQEKALLDAAKRIKDKVREFEEAWNEAKRAEKVECEVSRDKERD